MFQISLFYISCSVLETQINKTKKQTNVNLKSLAFIFISSFDHKKVSEKL